MNPEPELGVLEAKLADQSPQAIVSHVLSTFGQDVSIAFSGAEDVLLIEFAQRTRLPFRVFMLETGRLHPETLAFAAEVERHYGLRIEYCLPSGDAVEAMVREKGLYSFRTDGHEQCCAIRKIAPLRRHLSELRAWITGRRRDQSPTRAQVPVVEIDSSPGRAGAALFKFSPLAEMTSHEVWAALRAFEVPTNALHDRGFVSVGCEPCTRALLPGQHEREARWWWEHETKKECGIHLPVVNPLQR